MYTAFSSGSEFWWVGERAYKKYSRQQKVYSIHITTSCQGEEGGRGESVKGCGKVKEAKSLFSPLTAFAVHH